MTREEEITMAADAASQYESPSFFEAFVAGAKWADAHPDIDVRTMAAWQSGYKEAIEKACEWLDCYIDNYLFIDSENKAGIMWDDFINDFRNAMKSGSSEFPNNCEKGGEE